MNNILKRLLNPVESLKFLRVTFRKHSVWTKDLLIQSPYKKVNIPDCTLYEYIWQNLEKWPKRTASICAITGRVYTYEDVFKLSNTFAANLRTKFKIRDGDTVAVMLPNTPEYPIVNLGILQAGGIITNILSVYTPHEVQKYLTMSSAKIIVTHSEIMPAVTEAIRETKQNISVIVVQTNGNSVPDGTTLFNELSDDVHVDKSCLKEVKRSASDICFLAYSSGTMGIPKGVELSHRNIIANLEQNNEPLIKCHNETTLTHQDAYICVRPFSHIYGASVLMFHKLSIGAKLVTLNMYKYSLKDYFLQTLVKQKINVVMVPSSLVHLMSSHPEMTRKTFENVDMVVYGGAPLAASEVEQFCDKTERNIHIRQSYGLTETSPVVALTPEGLNCYAQIGPPLPNTELRIVDENLQNLGPNEIGEVLVRGPQVMRGYMNNRQADNETFTTDGWLRTGDIGAVDEQGILKISDRLKEIIKVTGYPVSPAELESLFREHPSVIDAGVVGVTHTTKGEIPKAFIVLKPGHKCTKKELSDFVKRRTVVYKHVQDIIFLDEIPKNAAGKVMRRTLKEKYC